MSKPNTQSRLSDQYTAQSPVEQPAETAAIVDDPIVELSGVSKTFGDETAVETVSLQVERGELLTLLGPSGCGKTTTLRMIAGLETPTEGTITIDDEQVASQTGATAPESRDVGIVFQDFALFPHLSVRENIAFGLSELDDEATAERVDKLLKLVDMPNHGEKSPEQLSGGQKQRIALARSLAPEPAVLLLDEPFSNLDVRLRVEMREEVRSILKEAGVTAVSVTHDQEEALSISDRVAVMNDGRLEQLDKPERIFESPKSRFVASFLGRASFLTGYVHDGVLKTGLGTFDAMTLDGYTNQYEGIAVDVLVRPDDLRAGRAADEQTDGEVTSRQYVGPSFIYRVDLDNGDTVHCMHNHVEDFDLGERVSVDLVADHPLAWYPREGAKADQFCSVTGDGSFCTLSETIDSGY